MKLEQALQRNPRKNAVTLATTGAAIISSYQTMKVISSIRVFNEEDIVPAQTYLGNCHFGSCSLYNIEVCAKTLYVKDHSKFCYEANMLTNFCHPNVSFLVSTPCLLNDFSWI